MDDELLKNLFTRAIRYVKDRFPIIDSDTRKDIAQDAIIKLIAKFDSSKVNKELNFEPHWNYLKYYLDNYCLKVLRNLNKNPIRLKDFEVRENSDNEDTYQAIPFDRTKMNDFGLQKNNEDTIEPEIEEDRVYNSYSPWESLIKFTIKYDIEQSNEKFISPENTENTGAFIISKYILLQKAFQQRKNGVLQFKIIYKPNSNFIKHYYEKGYLPPPIYPDTYYTRRYLILKEYTNRKWMELCILKLKEGLKLFIKFREKEIEKIKSNSYWDDDEKHREIERIENKWDNIPILSALAIDKDGHFIASCHKGEIESVNAQGKKRRFEKHCEYTLLEEIIASEKKEDKLIGGTLFVTLEPCNHRTLSCKLPDCIDKYCEHDDVELKIPCAVRCLESGISTIYVANFDTNKTVQDEGIKILQSGCYTFYLKNGNFCYKTQKGEMIPEEEISSVFHDPEQQKKAKKSIRAQKLLKERFEREMHYEIVYISDEKLIYRINDGIDVKIFHKDLIPEIFEINSSFLQVNGPEFARGQ
jgi:pyrimidine deaminase RibD-like protein